MADILMTLAGFESAGSGPADINASDDPLSSTSSLSTALDVRWHAHNSAESTTDMLINRLEHDEGMSPTMESLKLQVSASMGDDDRLDVDHELLTKDKSTCSSTELELIRRERNRMHAKKTRLRKKKMIHEMEAVSSVNESHRKSIRTEC